MPTAADILSGKRSVLLTEDFSPNLTSEEEAEFYSLAAELIEIPYCPWEPNEGPQTMFLLDMGREALYGGAAGGGKSIAALMAASQFLDVPGYSALVLRKHLGDLTKPGALLDIADRWWGGQKGCRWKDRDKTWEFECPNGGKSKIVFGFMDKASDRYQYQGGAYHCCVYDELTQFKRQDYLYLFSRLRREKTGPLARIPIRMRATTNPGGDGHEWVFGRFIAQWEKWRAGMRSRPIRNFHPALLKDNPMLDAEDYTTSMEELDPVTRAQLLRGDWNIRPDGRMFKRDWFKRIQRHELPGNCVWVRFWDMASTEADPHIDPDWTVGALVGRDNQGNYYIADMRRWRVGPAQNDLRCRATSLWDTRRIYQRMEKEPGSSGKTAIYHYRTFVFEGTNFAGVDAAGKGQGRTSTLTSKKVPQAKIVAAGPFASKAEAGQVYIVDDGSWDVDELLAEIEIFPDVNHDDQVDAISGAFSVLAKLQMTGLLIGDLNSSYEVENQWRPDAMPEGGWQSDVNEGWQGGRIRQAKELDAEEMRSVVQNLWSMN